ncbi:hypothetical protein ACSU6B_15880 [Neobacillus sp. C211]|uniref:hypothetical protein n=1 Tax=unclassified Neobacillus TaxID=2675272 RepID=UPI00397BF772
MGARVEDIYSAAIVGDFLLIVLTGSLAEEGNKGPLDRGDMNDISKFLFSGFRSKI